MLFPRTHDERTSDLFLGRQIIIHSLGDVRVEGVGLGGGRHFILFVFG
jgi:hypothetical protein